VNPVDAYLVLRARQSPTTFAGYVLRDATTNKPVKLAPQHRAMHALWNGDRAVVWAFAEGGKTTNLAARLAWELGRNPGLRINVVGGALGQAEKLTESTRRLIESDAYARVFPGVAVAKAKDGAFWVTGRVAFSPSASVTPTGLGQGSVLGQRFDLVVGDDLLDLDSTRTQLGRDRAWQALTEVHLSRLTPGGRVWLSGTAWNSDDVLERAARLPGWVGRRFPVLDSHGRSTWPERWPLDRVELRRQELRHAFSRVMMCAPLDESCLVFGPELIDRALLNGRMPHLSPVGGRVLLGVDPAFSVGPGTDLSAIVMVVVDDSNIRHLTHVEASRMNHDQLVDRVSNLARANKATVYIEANAGGGVLATMLAKRVPTKGLYTTKQSKVARVEALNAELCSDQWAFSCPLGSPSAELRALCQELESFSLDPAVHTGDRASALLVACEGARSFVERPIGRVFPWTPPGAR